MNQKYFTANQAISEVGCGRSTFFAHRNKLKEEPKKRGNKAYYTAEQIEAIKSSLNPPEFQTDTDRPKTKTDEPQKNEKQNTNEQETNSAEFMALAYLKEELQRKGKALEASQERVRTLSEEVGQWRGQAQAFEKLNNKLLEEQKEAQQIREAEIIPDEPDTAKEPSQVVEVEVKEIPKAEKNPKNFRQKWREFWKN